MAEKWPRDLWLEAIWEDPALKPNERVVAYTYARYAGKGNTTWCSWAEIMRRTGMRSKRTVGAALKSLQKAGWLTEIAPARQHRSAVYELSCPLQRLQSATAEATDGVPDGVGHGVGHDGSAEHSANTHGALTEDSVSPHGALTETHRNSREAPAVAPAVAPAKQVLADPAVAITHPAVAITSSSGSRSAPPVLRLERPEERTDIATASRGAASPFGRRSATARSDQAIAEATARRNNAIAAKIITEDTGVDRDVADSFVVWLKANRKPVDLIGYTKALADDRALAPLLEHMYLAEAPGEF